MDLLLAKALASTIQIFYIWSIFLTRQESLQVSKVIKQSFYSGPVRMKRKKSRRSSAVFRRFMVILRLCTNYQLLPTTGISYQEKLLVWYSLYAVFVHKIMQLQDFACTPRLQLGVDGGLMVILGQGWHHAVMISIFIWKFRSKISI